MAEQKLTANGNKCYCDGLKDPNLIACVYVYQVGKYIEIQMHNEHRPMESLTARGRKAMNIITKKLREAAAALDDGK